MQAGLYSLHLTNKNQLQQIPLRPTRGENRGQAPETARN
jgi:hypothetical protein